MDPLLIQYAQRFSFPTAKLDTFFTSLNSDQIVGNVSYMVEIETFCVRLYQAFINKEKICIYSDYDTDAVTATGVMYWGLRDLGFLPENLHFYAPDRFTEGYGMNTDAVKELSQKYNLIISVDCGINSVAEAKIVKQNPNCDLIITDHHHLHGQVPEAVAVINPRLTTVYRSSQKKPLSPLHTISSSLPQSSELSAFISKWSEFSSHTLSLSPQDFESFISKSPFALASETVTGVGVSWLCVLHLGLFFKELGLLQNSTQTLSKINRTLPLVAIGTIADCQSVLDPLNRVFVRAGLSIAQKNQHGIIGLEQLLKQTGLAEKIAGGYQLTSQDLAFTLSPILNSSGRLTHAQLSISVLVSDNLQEAQEKATQLIATNEERKQYVRSIIQEIEIQAQADYESGSEMLWLEGDWSKGIVGLVASRLVNKFSLPCVIISNQDTEHATASMRAPDGYHIPEAMKEAGEELFLKFGGHPGAAGFSAEYKNLPFIQEGMKKAFEEQRQHLVIPATTFVPSHLISQLPINLAITNPKAQSDIHRIWAESEKLMPATLADIWKLDPFGIDFPLPRFTLNVSRWTFRWLGQEQKHAKIQPENGISITLFNLEPSIQKLLLEYIPGQKIQHELWITATPSQNTWNGKTTHELIAEEIWASNDEL